MPTEALGRPRKAGGSTPDRLASGCAQSIQSTGRRGSGSYRQNVPVFTATAR
jgi:hypothetical protein